MRRRFCGSALTFLLLAVAASPAAAQGWTLDAYAGRAEYDQVAANVGTMNGVLGLRYRGPGGGWFYVSAAAPFASNDVSWGASGLGHRIALAGRNVVAGVDVGAHGYAYREPNTATIGAGATTQALPFVAVERGVARLEVRSGLLHYASTFGGTAQSRTLHDSGARLAVRGALPLELVAEARHARAEGASYPYVGASVSMRHGLGDAWVSGGQWFSTDIPDLSWGFGASLGLGQQAEVWASVQEESSHPLYWNDSRQSWTIGVSRRLGRVVRAQAPGPPAAQPSAGRVTFRVPVSESAAAPSVAGDFTGWSPVPMVRTGAYWTLTLQVGPGYHRYAFRSVEGDWFVPESVSGRRDDGFGGHVAILVVP